MHTQDGHLIQKCLDGDSAAFGFLVDKYRQSVYALAYSRLGNFHDAEDVTQEAFITAYEKLNTLKRWDSFYAWLYSITVNLCKMWKRSRANRPDREYLEDQDETVLDAPSIEAYQAELARQAGAAHEQVHQALAALPETYREVLTLYYLGGMSSQEIVQFLRTSPTAINMRLSRARAQLKEEILTMMSATFDQYKLQPSFTFRIVEQIKQTKIQTGIQKTALPWGISITTGLAVLLLILNVPFTPIFPIGRLIGSALPAETQVAEKGEIPVDVIKITEITILSSEKGKVDFGQKPKPEPTNAFVPPGQEGNMPTARVYPSTSVVKGKIYAIGGATFTPTLTTALNTVEEYDPTTDTWTRKAEMPTARWEFSASVVNDKIYVIGGETGVYSFVWIPTVEIYDPATDVWTKSADMRTPRGGHAAVAFNGKIYILGGAAEGLKFLPMLEEFDPGLPASVTSVTPAGKFPTLWGKLKGTIR